MRETFGAIQVLYIIIALAALVLHGFLAAYAGTIASDKGYTEARWGLLCFFLPVAYIVVAAMPDMRMRELQQESNNLLRETMIDRCGAVFAQPRFSTDNAMGVAILTWRALFRTNTP